MTGDSNIYANQVSSPEIRIRAIGSFIPARRDANQARLSALGLDEEFLNKKLGITRRAIKPGELETSDLCVEAFGDLSTRLAIQPGSIQLCCVVTQNPDHRIPHVSAIVHHKLGLARTCMTFDVSQGCAGYVCGLAIVTSVMERLGLDHALLFTCDPYSKIVDPEDRNTALIFGDAATATYLTRTGTGYALLDSDFGTVPASSACLRTEGTPPVLRMDGMAVLMNAVHEVPASIRGVLARRGWTLADVELALLHPGSKRVVDLIRRELDLPEAKVPFEIADIGNTVSSSIPLLLQRRLAEPRHRRLVLSGFGVGFSWGTCVVELRDLA